MDRTTKAKPEKSSRGDSNFQCQKISWKVFSKTLLWVLPIEHNGGG